MLWIVDGSLHLRLSAIFLPCERFRTCRSQGLLGAFWSRNSFVESNARALLSGYESVVTGAKLEAELRAPDLIFES